MSHKDELLAMMRAARADLEAVVASFGGRLDADMGDGWRVKDVLAHIALWEREATHKIAGTPLPYGADLAELDTDPFNEAMRERWRERDANDVLVELAAAHQALVAAVEGADEEDCAPSGRAWQAIYIDGAGHYAMHFPITDRFAAHRSSDGDA
jgi:hypothetical protein